MSRCVIVAAVLGCAATPVRADFDTLPLVAIGLPFAPETPQPLSTTQPLYRRVVVSEIDGLPAVVGSSALNFIGAAKRSSINAGLRDTFERMNMLALTDAEAKVRLTVRWVGVHTPFRIASHNTAEATLHYRLTRVGTEQVLFDRDITTSVKGGGVDASMRDNGIVRAAIAANFASIANCLDRATRGPTPEDCALTPKFSVLVERRRW